MIRKDLYQVFLLTAPATPWVFAQHPWFVVNKKGDVSRWEVVAISRDRYAHWGHIHKDILPPFQGIGMLLPLSKPSWNATLAGMLEGDEDSPAHRMITFIEASAYSYPHRERYWLLGPNSNTYVQRILDQFPESGMRLPWNAIGKGYRA